MDQKRIRLIHESEKSKFSAISELLKGKVIV